jgi:4-alpha-glucanotransferase
VRYPFDELAAVLAIESVRSRCVIVGEDLGTLPDGLHDGLRRWGILSTRLLYFEQDGRGNSRPASDYERDALISVGTHDLPPFAAYWRGDDLALKARISLFEDATILAREQERRALERASISAVISPAVKEAVEPPTIAAYRFLASTPSLIVMVQVEDALGLSEQVNLPGTFDEYPNWRHRLPCTVDKFFEHPQVHALCAVMREARPPQQRFET